MSDLIIIHRPFQSTSTIEKLDLKEPTFLKWETCLRQIYFTEQSRVASVPLLKDNEIYHGLDAEEFLIQILCGLKSPLVGETEVFGQFRNWWQKLSDQEFKSKFDSCVQQIFSVVKKTREENLSNLGSHTYGSLIRKKITESRWAEGQTIDFVGGGQLVEEITPWIQKKWSYRIWCRDVEKVKKTSYGLMAKQVLNISSHANLANHLVVAAPIVHETLHTWIAERINNSLVSVYDFRRDSTLYTYKNNLASYYHLDDLTSAIQNQKDALQDPMKRAVASIAVWKQQAEKRIHVRPFGWDDL